MINNVNLSHIYMYLPYAFSGTETVILSFVGLDPQTPGHPNHSQEKLQLRWLCRCPLLGLCNALEKKGMTWSFWFWHLDSTLKVQVSQCTPNNVPRGVQPRDSWGLWPINTRYIDLYRAYIGISNRGTLLGVHPTIPWDSTKMVGLIVGLIKGNQWFNKSGYFWGGRLGGVSWPAIEKYEEIFGTRKTLDFKRVKCRKFQDFLSHV